MYSDKLDTVFFLSLPWKPSMKETINTVIKQITRAKKKKKKKTPKSKECKQERMEAQPKFNRKKKYDDVDREEK